jgi:3' terminal RNA ribose 2'-O-methyltransferase Hen1
MEKQLTRLVGVDVSITALERAASRLKLDTMTERQRSRIELLQGSFTYRDSRFNGFDAIALVEVIEHLELDRLPALERVIFEYARPKTVIVTTPNRDYNAKFANLADGKLRHADHRFEWTRTEFATWCTQVAERFGYQVNIQPIGALDPELGSVTQMGVFSL